MNAKMAALFWGMLVLLTAIAHCDRDVPGKGKVDIDDASKDLKLDDKDVALGKDKLKSGKDVDDEPEVVDDQPEDGDADDEEGGDKIKKKGDNGDDEDEDDKGDKQDDDGEKQDDDEDKQDESADPEPEVEEDEGEWEPEVRELNYIITDEVWFEINIKDYYEPGKDYVGRIVIGVFGDMLPLTALNFVSIARGYNKKGKVLTYKNNRVHRVIQDFVIQLGDIVENNGEGGDSIYGGAFKDEGFYFKHSGIGWVAMANRGEDTNTSQFYIMLMKARWLDGKNVVFAKVVQGFDVLEVIGSVGGEDEDGRPQKYTRVTDCGVNNIAEYVYPEHLLDRAQDYHVVE